MDDPNETLQCGRGVIGGYNLHIKHLLRDNSELEEKVKGLEDQNAELGKLLYEAVLYEKEFTKAKDKSFIRMTDRITDLNRELLSYRRAKALLNKEEGEQ